MTGARITSYFIAALGVGLAAVLLKPFGARVNATTVALSFLLVVLFVATFWGSRPALLASVLAVLCFNFFFLPPVGTFSVADPDNWVALLAFLVVAMTAGQLSARARRRAEEAEAGRREIERLYRELREAFERASHAEALRQSERLKSALLDAVTHDIRTPLTSIKASVTTLLDAELRKAGGARAVTLDADSRRDMLEVIDEECDRLDRFAEGLVELARIEAGEMNLRRRWGALDDIIAAALERAAPLVAERRVEVETEDGLPAARVDPRAVAEVVYALVDNAAKYSPPGAPVRVAARRGAGEMIEVSVEDEGPGVPPGLRERVFVKFFRAEAAGAAAAGLRPSGTGMGLAIARGIVEAHGGHIRVEDAPRHGARFVFTLPIGGDEETEAGE